MKQFWLLLLCGLLIAAFSMTAGCTDEVADDKDEDDDRDGGDGGDLGTGVDGGDGTDGTDGSDGAVENLRLDGTVYVDPSAGVTRMQLEHRGGDRITWNDYMVTLDGAKLTDPRKSNDNSTVTTAEVGETTQWWDTKAARAVGQDYTVKVIDIETDTIVWEKTLTSKVFQTP